MAIVVKTHAKFVSDMAASWAADLGIEPSLPEGDPVLAWFESVASQLENVLGQIQVINAFARASTANGADLDSFFDGDFGFPRLQPQKANGIVTFSLRSIRNTATVINLGSLVQNADGSQVFEVIADTNIAGWSSEQNAYLIPSGQLSVDARVRALLAGSGGDLQPGKVISIITGNADAVTNENAFSGGTDVETDADYRKRFPLWINSRSKATRDAIFEAVIELVPNVKLVENRRPPTEDVPDGPEEEAYFTVIIDDGTGDPPDSLITLVTQAVEAVRGFTIEFSVIKPQAEDLQVAMTINVDPDFEEGTVSGNVRTALFEYVNGLEIGKSLYLSKLITVASNVEGVLNVEAESTTVNTLEQDFVATQFQVLRLAEEDLAVTVDS